jgi:hypothetical protein
MAETVAQNHVQWIPLVSVVSLSKGWLINNKMYFSEIGDDGRMVELAQGSIPMAGFVNSNVQLSASVIRVD